jgi:hypothetical protein
MEPPLPAVMYEAAAFPIWEVVVNTRNAIAGQLRALRARPQVGQRAAPLQAALRRAADVDKEVEKALAAYSKPGGPALPDDGIEGMIDQAFLFYDEALAKLAELDRSP